VILIFAITYTLVGFDINLVLKIGIILPLYYGISVNLFSGKRGDFYVDEFGIIQPEFFNKNYAWGEIDDFRISNSTIDFSLKSKKYSVEISEETKLKLLNIKADNVI